MRNSYGFEEGNKANKIGMNRLEDVAWCELFDAVWKVPSYGSKCKMQGSPTGTPDGPASKTTWLSNSYPQKAMILAYKGKV